LDIEKCVGIDHFGWLWEAFLYYLYLNDRRVNPSSYSKAPPRNGFTNFFQKENTDVLVRIPVGIIRSISNTRLQKGG
jgi:hypothetical protein